MKYKEWELKLNEVWNRHGGIEATELTINILEETIQEFRNETKNEE